MVRGECWGQDVVATVPKARELFDQASQILGYDLLQVCVEGALACNLCTVLGTMHDMMYPNEL